TWDGVALHAGKNPGFPDSHGCIRLTPAFAKKLFSITSDGTNVVVTDQMVGDHFDPALLQTVAMQANQAQRASLDR
ncbi:L,D-transpeptidase family protein, partial [Escherichia coli]|uniref:L,D-transpeptidase family protein n=1 Tax=Escherichia coli TaxID=562 RepID=UPI0028DFA560